MPLQRYTAGEWQARPADRSEAAGTSDQREAVRTICRRVATDGDAALREYGLRFDDWAPAEGESWALERSDLERALAGLPASQRDALELAGGRIRAFDVAETFSDVRGPGGLALRVRPARRAGVHVRRGAVPYPS